jgi:hypothetical protein
MGMGWKHKHKNIRMNRKKYVKICKHVFQETNGWLETRLEFFLRKEYPFQINDDDEWE